MFAQQVISVLMEFADEGKTDHLSFLDEALGSLQHATNPSASPSRRATALGSYEQLRTLEEVWSDKGRKKAIQMIRTIQRAPSSPGSKLVANELIDLFSNLQNQALWNFEQPKPVSQKVMQRLCQLA
jgi:hypothetical protein